MKIPEIQFHISYSENVKKSELLKITSSQQTYEAILPLFDKSIHWQEEMILLSLNRANQVVGFRRISSGGANATICDSKIVFTLALNSHAQAIILAHNHPSGALKPSEADLQLTDKIKAAGKLLDIPLIDHLIVTDEGFYSFADNGLIY